MTTVYTNPFYASPWDNPVIGTEDSDKVYGSTEDDVIYGNGGSDKLYGGMGHDTIYGGDGNDEIDGDRALVDEWGYDSVAAGDDILIPGNGSDTVIGGDGEDTVIYDGTYNDYFFTNTGSRLEVVDQRAGKNNSTDYLTSVEFLTFTDRESVPISSITSSVRSITGSGDITGSNYKDIIQGSDLNDTISSLNDDDIITPGKGDDVIDGGYGTDEVIFNGNFSDYKIEEIGIYNYFNWKWNVKVSLEITDQRLSNNEGKNTLKHSDSAYNGKGIELLTFKDRSKVKIDNLDISSVIQPSYINGYGWSRDISGTSKNDKMFGTERHETFDGKEGIDTVHYNSKFQDYSFIREDNSLKIIDEQTNYKNLGEDTLKNIEYIQFTDQTVDESKVDIVKTYSGNFSDYKFYNKGNGVYQIKTDSGYDDITGLPLLTFTGEATTSSFRDISAIVDIKGTFDQVTGLNTDDAKMFRLYNASFKRLPDADGLKYWIGKYTSGENDDRAVASSFLVSNEFKTLYGENVTDTTYVNNLYQNVLGRLPDSSGLNYWLGQLNSGTETRYEVLLGFAESAENKALFTDMTGFG
ncbi:DUF4214 domain-containing protein [Prochlorococcus sp. MIT 0916]|uniref:DUF4214 domain-containing protein n=1 Tax=Prochlorococcus sp. MIT 0916 TaxID=3082521 RepID=UPI0039B46761